MTVIIPTITQKHNNKGKDERAAIENKQKEKKMVNKRKKEKSLTSPYTYYSINTL